MALEYISPIMTIFHAHQTIFRFLLEKTGDQNEARAIARRLTDELAATPHAHLAQPERVLPPSQQARFGAALNELKNHRPLPYILGECEFYKLNFQCDERTLIPRPETELLVEVALKQFKIQLPTARAPEFKTFRVADLGTGSGCVAIAMAVNAPDAQICATDISPDALELARENARAHGVAERIQFVLGAESDWATPLREYSRPEGGGFDVIVSNPPYIAPRDIENLPPPIKDYEPRRALDGGADGLNCYRQIAAQCGALLRPNGILACELGAGQFAEVRAIFENENWRVQKSILDFAGIERVLAATL
jgi:release factor glutamine methyltransferase